MDIFGMAVLALLPLLGAVIRDVLLGYFPPIHFVNVVYVTVVLAVTPSYLSFIPVVIIAT